MLLTGATYRAGAFERALREMFAAATERRWGYADGKDDAGCGAAAGGGGGDAGEASMLATRAAQEHCHKLSSVMESRPIAGLSRDCPPHPAHAFVVATILSQAPPGPFLFRKLRVPARRRRAAPPARRRRRCGRRCARRPPRPLTSSR